MLLNLKVSKWFYIILIIFGTILLGTVILNHYFFRTFAFDYAAYNFAWYDFAHLHSSPCPIYWWPGDVSFIQDHFSLTLIILSPLYWLFSPIFGTYSLLIIQTGFVLWGAWGVYKLVKLKTQNELFSILALLLYFLTYGRYASLITDANLEIILSSLIPVFLYFFEKKQFTKATILFIFIIVGRENFSLWFIFIGLYLMLSHWKEPKMRKLSLVYIVSSIIYFIVLFKFLIPAVENPVRPFSLFNYSALGKNPYEALITLLTKPEKTFSLLFVNHLHDIQYNFVKIEFYFVYIFSGGILLFWRPKYLLLFIPVIAQKMYNDAPIRWSIESYYSIEIVTLLPIVVFLALNELKFPKFPENYQYRIKKYIGIAIIIAASLITIYKFDINHRTIKWYGVEKNKFYDSRMYSSSFDVKKVYKYLKLIPDTAKVSATGNITPHLAFRKKIYYFPRVDDADYLALLQNKIPYFQNQQQFADDINKYLFNPNWSIIIDDYPFILLKKQKNTYSDYRNYFCDCENLSQDSNYFLTGINKFEFGRLRSDNHAKSGKYSVRLNKNHSFGITIKIDSIIVGTHIQVSVWRYKQGGVLVASAENAKELYVSSGDAQEKTKTGWEKLVINLFINNEIKDHTLKFYVWKDSDSDDVVFFDDLRIMIR